MCGSPPHPAEQQLCLSLMNCSGKFADISVEFAGGKKSRSVANALLGEISV
jgi:hypothetical protein